MIYYSGEPFYNIGNCDFALTSFYVNDPRFFRLPLYTLYAYDLFKNKVTDSYDFVTRLKPKNNKPKFCAYIAQGGGQNSPREYLFNQISAHKLVDAAGRHLNNHPLIPGEPGTPEGSINKIEFLKNYQYSMAIENSNHYNGDIGYTTEKIFEPMISESIPIYWGNPFIEKDFNTNSFINCNNIDVADYLKKIDSDNSILDDICSNNYVLDNPYFNEKFLIDMFGEIIK